MRDVCARTGLARSTIHHYIREGVLPQPTKTGRNTAVYDEDFVRRALLVKTLQGKTHMPLAQIRETLNGMSDEAVETLDPERFSSMTRTIADSLRLASEMPMRRADLLEMADLKPIELKGMAAAGLIDDADPVSPLDVRIVLAVQRIRRAGATVEAGFLGSEQIAKAYRKHLTELAKTEAREMVRLLRPLATIDLDTFIEQTLEPLGDLVAAVHRKALMAEVLELLQNGDGKKPQG